MACRLPGVTVTAKAAIPSPRLCAVTNAEGVATLEALALSTACRSRRNSRGFAHSVQGAFSCDLGQTTTLPALTLGAVSEVVNVTASSPLVDTRSATSGQDITLQLTESLPTGRSYQSYLQMIPGVMPDDPTTSGNPPHAEGSTTTTSPATWASSARPSLLRRHQRHRPVHRDVLGRT